MRGFFAFLRHIFHPRVLSFEKVPVEKIHPPQMREEQPFSTTLSALNEWNAKRDLLQGPCYRSGGRQICGRGTLGCRVIHPQVSEEIYEQKDWDRASIALQIASQKDGQGITAEDRTKLRSRGLGERRITRR